MSATKTDVVIDGTESFQAQERVIGALPSGSTLLELPAWAKWLVVHPTEPTQCITADGRMITLDPPLRSLGSADKDWKAEWDERARESAINPPRE